MSLTKHLAKIKNLDLDSKSWFLLHKWTKVRAFMQQCHKHILETLRITNIRLHVNLHTKEVNCTIHPKYTQSGQKSSSTPYKPCKTPPKHFWSHQSKKGQIAFTPNPSILLQNSFLHLSWYLELSQQLSVQLDHWISKKSPKIWCLTL